MATRKAPPPPSDGGERAPPRSKRRRIHQSFPASFESLNKDCLVLVLSFLSSEEMNNVAECNRFCREARCHDSLDQTRTGTIVWTMPFFIDTVFYDMIAERDYQTVFQGNRSRLRVESYAMRSTRYVESYSADQVQRAQLPGITSLDMSCHSPEHGHVDRNLLLIRICQILPNLKELDASNLIINDGVDDMRNEILRLCPNLTCVTWKGSSAPLSGHYFPEMRELNSDNSIFHMRGPFLEERTEGRDYEEEPTDGAAVNFFMLMDCKYVERLSIKGTSYGMGDMGFQPVTQAMLIKMVRHHATLQWLRSDLSEENVVMLKQERPEITFVSK